MDFWASLEHKIRYKKNIPEDKALYLQNEMLECAEISADLDRRMQNVRGIVNLQKKCTKRKTKKFPFRRRDDFRLDFSK